MMVPCWGTGRLIICTDYMAHNLITFRNTNLSLEITLYVAMLYSFHFFHSLVHLSVWLLNPFVEKPICLVPGSDQSSRIKT